MTTLTISSHHGTGREPERVVERGHGDGVRDRLVERPGEEQAEEDRDRGARDRGCPDPPGRSRSRLVGLVGSVTSVSINPHTIGHGKSNSTPSASQPKRNRVVHSRVR